MGEDFGNSKGKFVFYFCCSFVNIIEFLVLKKVSFWKLEVEMNRKIVIVMEVKDSRKERRKRGV